MGNGVWIGALTTLIGAALGGAISFTLSRQQLNDARTQRKESAEREQCRRSEDRRYQAYSEFLTRTRSYRNAVQAYYVHADNRPSIHDIDVFLLAANDAAALVLLLVETEGTYHTCDAVLEALWRAQKIIHHIEAGVLDDPWSEINNDLGQTTTEFQNAVRAELGVNGPDIPWTTYYEKSHPDILAVELERNRSNKPH